MQFIIYRSLKSDLTEILFQQILTMKYRELKLFLHAGLVSSVRVMPFSSKKTSPDNKLEKSWCIDVLIENKFIKQSFQFGSSTGVLESDRSTKQCVQIRRFASIDSAAKYLKQLGVSSFRVDLDDTLSFAATDGVALLDAAATEAEVSTQSAAIKP